MKYAFINGNRVEAVKGAKGICPGCKADVIAKCGERKVPHWAHKSVQVCDPWWENETEWHRKWKNYFPETWQEISMHDQERNQVHIADVRTSDGLVIEFQNSPIHPNERRSRESFYKNMVWVINGTRLKGDYPRFCRTSSQFRRIGNTRVFKVDYIEEGLPKAWIDSVVPVLFDFKGNEIISGPDLRNALYCLLPKTKNSYRVLIQLLPKDFVALTISGQWSGLLKTNAEPAVQKQISAQSQPEQIAKPRRISPYYYDRNGRLRKHKRL